MTKTNYFSHFCEHTTLHGWNWIVYNHFKVSHVIFWFLAIFSALIASIYGVAMLYFEFSEATVTFGTETVTEPITNVYFPAIYLANKNTVRRSILMASLEETGFKINTSEAELLFAIGKNYDFGPASLSAEETDIVKGN